MGGVRAADVEAELERVGHELRAGDVVLVWTGTNLKEPGYHLRHAGLRRNATELLVDRGVRLIGIDAWALDRAFDVMLDDARAGPAQFWESHLLGRSKEYCQIERLTDLELPRPTGFTVYAFPYQVESASAAWARVVAIFEGGGMSGRLEEIFHLFCPPSTGIAAASTYHESSDANKSRHRPARLRVSATTLSRARRVRRTEFMSEHEDEPGSIAFAGCSGARREAAEVVGERRTPPFAAPVPPAPGRAAPRMAIDGGAADRSRRAPRGAARRPT